MALAVASVVLIAGVAVAIVVATGSGDDETETVTAEASATTESTTDVAPTPTQEEPPPDPEACSTKGIVPLDSSTPAGKCTAKGTRFTVVEADGLLKTKTMTARFEGVRQTTSLSDPDGFTTETADGTYVVVTVSVTSRLDSPVEVDSFGSQAALVLGNGKSYDEDFDALNGADEQSFMWQDDSLQPDQTRSGDFVFDIPPKGLREYQRNGGALVIAELGKDVDDDTKRLGVIRLPAP